MQDRNFNLQSNPMEQSSNLGGHNSLSFIQPQFPCFQPILQHVHNAYPNVPADPNETTTITKLAQYVVKNGLEFEAVVKQREIDNPLFSFLWENGKYNDYYKYAIHCFKNNLPLQANPTETSITDHMSKTQMKGYNLNQQQINHLNSILSDLNCSRDFISKARDWIISILPFGGLLLAYYMRKFAQDLVHAKSSTFDSALCVIYILNDIFFAPNCPPSFKKQCLPQLPTIIRCSALMAKSDEEIQKISRVVEIWKNKDIFQNNEMLEISMNFEMRLESPPSPIQAEKMNQNLNDTKNNCIEQNAHHMPMVSPPLSMMLPQQPPLPPHMINMYTSPQFSNTPIYPKLPPLQVPPPFQQNVHPPFQQSVRPPFQQNIHPNFQSNFPRPPLVPFQPNFPVGGTQVQPSQDLSSMQVGIMVNIVRSALRNGAKPYAPIELARLPPSKIQQIEPGRLDVRLSDYYRLLTLDDDVREREAEKEERKREIEMEMERKNRKVEKDKTRKERDKEKLIIRGQEIFANSKLETSISEDNLGYQALKKMGWQEGLGLGSLGKGISEPVKNGGQNSRFGVGVKTKEESDMDIFEKYRKTKSYNTNR
mmetsp:Transcript_5530/g.7791  ORF Transcript_5530/g.7791 Transcript_5530/m.7791 type:complete len:594 (+) Transcript_5530:154-1935(+)